MQMLSVQKMKIPCPPAKTDVVKVEQVVPSSVKHSCD